MLDCLRTLPPETHAQQRVNSELTSTAAHICRTMSSGFVSGGTADEPIERDEEWKRAAQELENARKAKEDLEKQHDGKTLYEILQANKERKQAEFEEKARFKLHNALDDDEADYLESLLERRLQEEAIVKRETSEQLELFRKQREESERKSAEGHAIEEPTEVHGPWVAVGRKRKKGVDGALLKGVKLRKSNAVLETGKTTTPDNIHETGQLATTQASKPAVKVESVKTTMAPSANATDISTSATKAKQFSSYVLGAGYASSDDDD